MLQLIVMLIIGGKKYKRFFPFCLNKAGPKAKKLITILPIIHFLATNVYR